MKYSLIFSLHFLFHTYLPSDLYANSDRYRLLLNLFGVIPSPHTLIGSLKYTAKSPSCDPCPIPTLSDCTKWSRRSAILV